MLQISIRATARKTIELLAERFPDCFSIYEQRRRPLKIGIHLDILAALDGMVTPDELASALRYCCANRQYLRAIVAGAERIDLDGKLAGTITKKEAEHALTKVKTGTEISAEARKRMSLTDLKAAAQARKQAVS